MRRNLGKQARWNRKVVAWAFRRAECLLERLERRRSAVVAVDVTKSLFEASQRFRVSAVTVLHEAFVHPGDDRLTVLRATGDAHHQRRQAPAPRQVLQRRNYFLE